MCLFLFSLYTVYSKVIIFESEDMENEIKDCSSGTFETRSFEERKRGESKMKRVYVYSGYFFYFGNSFRFPGQRDLSRREWKVDVGL